MKTLKVFFWIAVIYAFTIFFSRPIYTNSIQQKNPIDYRVAKLEAFFKGYNAPIGKYAKVFIEVADKNNLDWRLLPSVAMVESSGGKNYRLNMFGWGSDTLDFGDDTADIFGVSQKIATLPHYKIYRESRRLDYFCLAYNGNYAKTYCEKLNWFYKRLGVCLNYRGY